MADQIISSLQVVALVLGLAVSLLTIGKHFRESGFFRNVLYLILIILPIIFLKFVVLLGAEKVRELYTVILAGWITITFIELVCYITEYDYLERPYKTCLKYTLSKFKSSHDITTRLLTTLPIAGFGFTFFPQPNSSDIQNYLNHIRTGKINLALFSYMGENLFFTAFFVIKLAEVIIMGYCFFVGASQILKRPNELSCRFTDTEMQIAVSIELLTALLISSNLYFLGLKIIFEQFG